MPTARSTRNLFLWWLVLALALGPLLVVPLFPGPVLFDNQRLLQMSCALLALGVLAWQVARGEPLALLLSRPLAVGLGLFFALGLLSGVLAHSPRHALFEWANLLLLLGCAWLIAAEVASDAPARLDRLLLLAGLACVLYLLQALLMYLVLLALQVQASPFKLIPGYDNYRYFNHVQTVTLPLLGLLAARTPQRGLRNFWWSVTALWWMLLFVSAGRGTLIGMLLGLGMAWLTLPGMARAWCRAMLGAALLGLLTYFLFYVAIPAASGLAPYGQLFGTVERSIGDPTSSRAGLWGCAFDLIHAHPWLGVGPAHYAHANCGLTHSAGHPHNWLLQIGSEWGLPALALLSGLLGHLLWRLRQLRLGLEPAQHATLAAWTVGTWAILGDSLVSGLIVMPMSQLWLAFFLGCCWGWCRARAGVVHTWRLVSAPWWSALVLLAAVAGAYVLVQGVAPDLLARIGPQEIPITGRPRILFNGAF